MSLGSLACSSGSSPSTPRTRRDGRPRPPRSLRPSSKPSASRPRFVPLADGRANVVGRIDNGDGPCFAFNSHMDTVPVGGGWTSDPFRLTERDGKLFGRGACDAKGPIVAMAEAGRLLAVAAGPMARHGCDAAPETSSTATSYAVSAGAQGSGTGFHQYSIREFADELLCVLAISTRWSGDNRMQTRDSEVNGAPSTMQLGNPGRVEGDHKAGWDMLSWG